MANRRVDPRRISIHRPYTIVEAARALGVHKNTFSAWIKAGLPVADELRPLIVSGEELRAFLLSRQTARRRPLETGQFYCFGCRGPVAAAGAMADFIPRSATLGRLQAICSVCDRVVNRSVSLARLADVSTGLDLKMQGGAAAHRRDQAPHR